MSSKLQPIYPGSRGPRAPKRTILKRYSPWNGNYALPKNVWDESRSGGAIVTRQLKRGTVFPFTGGGAGYAIPKGIKNEGWRRVQESFQQPRGTVFSQNVSAFAGLSSLDTSSLEGSSLGYWGEGLVDDIGHGIKKAAKGVWKGAKMAAGLACKVGSNAPPGVPYGSYVSAAANGLCPHGTTPATPPPGTEVGPPISSGGGVSTNTLLIAGAGIVALVLLTRK